MIQRIQSIYLVLAGLFPAITYFVPLVLFTQSTGTSPQWFTLSSLCYDATSFAEMTGRHPWGLMITALIAVILPIVTIFGYNNRKKQIEFVNYAMFVNLLWYVALIAYTFSVKDRTLTTLSFEVGCLFPLLSLITLYLAKHAIKRDEALVRAADRIR